MISARRELVLLESTHNDDQGIVMFWEYFALPDVRLRDGHDWSSIRSHGSSAYDARPSQLNIPDISDNRLHK